MVYPLQSVTPATPDRLDDLDPTVIDFPDKVPPMEAAFKQSVDVEPDHAANVLDLSDKLGQPPEFVHTNLDVAKKAAAVPPSQYFADVTKAYPLTAEYLSDPKNMAVARDDIHNLTKNESLVQGYSRMERLWRTANYAGATLGADLAKLPATIYDIAAIPQNLLAKATGHPEFEAQASDGFRNNPVANFYARQMEAWKPPPLPDYVDLAKNGDYLGAGQKVAESLVEFAPALAVSAMSAGAGVAIIGEQATSGALDRNRELGIDPGISGLNAAYHGAFAAALMDVGVLGPFKKWGESLASVVGPDSAKKVMLGMFSAMGHSASTFGTMSGASSFANDYTDYATGVNPHALEGSLKRSADAAIGGILQGGILGAVSATGGAIGRGANIRRTIQAQQIYDALQKNIEASKMYDRAPGLAEGLLDKQVKGTPLENINIPAEAFDTYFQSKNIDPNDLARELGVEDQLKNARESNADVSIPLSKWAGKLAKTEHYTALKNDIRFVEGESTVNEKKQIDDRMVEGIQAENAKAIAENPAIDEGRKFIYEDQRKQMEALGQLDPKVIEANAKMGADLITNLAIKNKVDPKEFYAKNPLRIIQPSAEAVSQAAAAQGGRLDQEGRDLTQTPEFKKWFGESKVTDASGKPATVYHGTVSEPFTEFKHVIRGPGFWFSDTNADAAFYEGTRGRVMATHLSIKNPADSKTYTKAEDAAQKKLGRGASDEAIGSLVRQTLVRKGYDGVHLAGTDEKGNVVNHWVAFDPSQIKSVDNRGTFDPNDPNILHQGELNQNVPVVQPVKSGEPYGLFSYNTDMNPEGEMRSMYTIYGDPEHPHIKVGIDAEGKPLPGAGNTTQPLSWFQERGIPIKGMEPRAAKEGWKPLDYPQGETLFQSAASSPPAFYSQVERTIDSKMGAKATGDQILAMLKNTPGVKQDELNWMGLDIFLKDHKGQIEKKELQDFIQANKVEIHEVTKGGDSEAQVAAEKNLNDVREQAQRAHDEFYSYAAEHTPEQSDFDKLSPEIKAEWMRRHTAYINSIPLKEAAEKQFRQNQPDTKFSAYTLPGGENYREMLFTLPRERTPEYLALNTRAGELMRETTDLMAEWKRVSEENAPGDPRTLEAYARLDAVRKQRDQAQTELRKSENEYSSNQFESSHWDEPNVLAHVRMNDRTGPNGEKILHIEEVQSDWHQKGREKGYHTGAQELKDLARQVDEWRETKEKILKEAEPYSSQGKDAPQELIDRATEAQDKIIALENAIRNSKLGVPDAPFKKSWHEFALKRMLRYAAENGYDKITWPTGEQQAERYNLANQVDHLNYQKNSDGTYKVSAQVGGQGHMLGDHLSESELSDHVGKDVAQKMVDGHGAENNLAGNNEPRNIWKKLEGVDLKVGGEGMKGFYDKIIPEFLNKYTKKWGGRVGETKIATEVPKNLDRVTEWLTEHGHEDGTADVQDLIQEHAPDWVISAVESGDFDSTPNIENVSTNVKVHSLDITPAMKDSVMQGQTLFQGNPDPESNPRAFLQSTSHESILAMIKPDESTYPHEMAHYWLKGFHSFIESGLGEEKHLADWKILSDWLKIEEGQKGITRDQQEQFAKGFEVYVMEGKAPRAELAPVFAKFRKWISAVYRHLFPYTPEEQQMIREGWLISKHPSLDVRVSPAMRGFMDRMLASEDEIAFAQKDVSLDPGAEMHIEGLDAKVQARLEKLRGEAHEEAVHRLTVLQMKEMSAEHQAKMTDEALKARVQAEDAVRNSPAQTAMRAIEQSFGKDPLKTSHDYWLNKMGADDRAQYELMAEVRGFTSGDEMAQKVIAEQPVEAQIQAMVDAHMAQFPDLRETINIKEEAQKAVHNERSTEVMALERAILQTKANEAQGRRVDQMRRAEEAKIEAIAARKRAQELIAAKPISAAGKFLPYFTAERNAAMRVQEALASKDYAAAAEAKRQQMLNHALASEAFKVRQRIERWTDYVHDVEKKDKALFKQEEHFNQVAAILDRFGMTREDYDPATKTESFASWGERMILQDEAVSIAPWLFDETIRKPFGSLTVDEAHDVVNALKNIQRIANAQQNFYRLMDGASVMNTVIDLTNEAAIYNKPQEAEGIMRRQNTVLERTKKWIRGYDSTLRTIENVALKLGGWKDSSLWLKVLWDPVERAADAESDLMKPLNEGYEKLLTDHFSPKDRRALVDYSEAKFIPELKQSVRRIDLLMMALNTGNEGNRARLFQTPIVGVGPDVPWGEQPVMDMLQKHLTANDWKFVNGTWKLIHSLWPKEVDIHKEITGFTPGRVEPLPFSVTTPEGEVVQMDGGYFPLKADNRANLQTEIREQVDDPLYTERNPAWKATTKTGHLQGRIEGAKYPVALDSSIIQRHLRDAVHDIAFRATVIDLRRLIGNQQFANTVKNYAGEEQYKALRDWVGSVASGNAREKAALSYWENVSKAMRAKYSAAVLMFNPKIVTQNLSNAFLFAGAVEGYDWGDATHAFINKGILDFIPSSLVKAKRAEEFRQRIYEKSTFMRDKANSPEYSIQQTFDKLTGKSHKMSDFFYGYFSAADELTTLPNWQVAYEKKVSQGASETDAVAYADTLIRRSVGAARKYETAPIFRGTEMDKTLATFQGFMNAQQNRWERERGIWGQNYIKNSPRFAGYVAAHFGLFAAASNILSGNLPSFTDEDKMKKWMKSLLLYKFQMMPGVNAISSVVADEFLHLPSFGYRPVPQTAIIEKALDALKIGIAYGEGRGEGKDVLETATHTGAFLLGQPDQFLKLLWNAYDIAFEGMTPQFDDLLGRRPKKERQ
jgi:hypothetical protein